MVLLNVFFFRVGIYYKIVTFVSDNGENEKNAINEYHHPCGAHLVFNLTVNNAIVLNENLSFFLNIDH